MTKGYQVKAYKLEVEKGEIVYEGIVGREVEEELKGSND